MSNNRYASRTDNRELLARFRARGQRSSINTSNRDHRPQDSGYFGVASPAINEDEDEDRAPTPCNIPGLGQFNWPDDLHLEPGQEPFSMNFEDVQKAFKRSNVEKELLGKNSGWAMSFNDPMSGARMASNEHTKREVERHHVEVKGKEAPAIDRQAMIEQRERDLYALLGPEYVGRTGPSYGATSFLRAEAAMSNSNVSPLEANPASWYHAQVASEQPTTGYHASPAFEQSTIWYQSPSAPEQPTICRQPPPPFEQTTSPYHAPPPSRQPTSWYQAPPPSRQPTSWYQAPPPSRQPTGWYQAPPPSRQPTGWYQAPPPSRQPTGWSHGPPTSGQPAGRYQAQPPSGRTAGRYQAQPPSGQPAGRYQAPPSSEQPTSVFHRPFVAEGENRFAVPSAVTQPTGLFYGPPPSERPTSGIYEPSAAQDENNIVASSAVTIICQRPVTRSQDPLAEVFAQRAGTAGAFLPSRLVSFSPQLLLTATPHDPEVAAVEAAAYNPNYYGQRTVGSNQDPTVPDNENTALWVMNIPAEASMGQVLNSIRDCGRIFQCHINPPSGSHMTQAAKIVFCRCAGAIAFQEAAKKHPGIHILGQRISVRPNRNKYRENLNANQTRVLRIRGPTVYVNTDFLSSYFDALFRSDVLEVKEGPVDSFGFRSMDWYFGSILAQAASAKLAIENEPAFIDSVIVTYRPDPCE